MKAGDWIAMGSALVALVALGVSLSNRRGDIARDEQVDVRSRVWGILQGEAGERTVRKQDDPDGRAEERVGYLTPTVQQLRTAGAPAVADALQRVINENCLGEDLSDARRHRDEFFVELSQFMTPPKPTGWSRIRHQS